MYFAVTLDSPVTTSTDSAYKSGFVVQTTGATAVSISLTSSSTIKRPYETSFSSNHKSTLAFPTLARLISPYRTTGDAMRGI